MYGDYVRYPTNPQASLLHSSCGISSSKQPDKSFAVKVHQDKDFLSCAEAVTMGKKGLFTPSHDFTFDRQPGGALAASVRRVLPCG